MSHGCGSASRLHLVCLHARRHWASRSLVAKGRGWRGGAVRESGCWLGERGVRRRHFGSLVARLVGGRGWGGGSVWESGC